MFHTENLCYNCFHEKNLTGVCPYCGYDNSESMDKYPTAIKEGSILNGQYIVGRVLGQGGFGITYLALDHQLNIKVAIKEYLPDGMATRFPGTTHVSVYVGEKLDNFNYGAERFLDEARVLAKFIGNKNIVGVKSYFKENNTAYFVMDYIEGISFKSYIKNHGGKIDYPDAMRVLVPVMDALALVHQEGIIHRDVTPDNIYITKDNEVKLLDFGSARYSLGDKSKSLDVILKAGYAPKEQYIRRGKQGSYTDIYSLAACFYASITGYLPPEALERMENDEIVELSTRGFRIPQQMENAIMKGLEVRAEDRFQSIEQFKAAIVGNITELYPLAQTAQEISKPTHELIEPVQKLIDSAKAPIKTNQNQLETIQNYETSAPVIEVRDKQKQMKAAGFMQPPIILSQASNLSEKYKQNIVKVEENVTGHNVAEHNLTESNAAENNVAGQIVTEDNIHSEQAALPSTIQTNAVIKFLQNKRNRIITSAACVILVVLLIGITILNNLKEDTTIITSSEGQGSKEADIHVGQADNTNQPEEIEPIEVVVGFELAESDSATVEFSEQLDSALFELSKKLSIPFKLRQVYSEDELYTVTQESYISNKRSICFGYFDSDVLDVTTSYGSIVKQSMNLEEGYFVITGVEEGVASEIVNELDTILADNIVLVKNDMEIDSLVVEKTETDQVNSDNTAESETITGEAAAAQVDVEKAADEKTAADKVAVDKTAAAEVATNKATTAKADAEKATKENAAAEIVAAEKAKAAKVAAENAAAAKAAAEKDTADKAAAERAVTAQKAADKAAAEQAAAEKEAAEKAAAEKAAAERAAADRAAAEKAAAERAAAERAAAEKAAAEKAAAEKAAAEKAAAEKAAAEKAAEEEAAKYITCSNCNGTGIAKCYRCDGTGYFVRDGNVYINADGYISRGRIGDPCNMAHTETKTCSVCNGTGKVHE